MYRNFIRPWSVYFTPIQNRPVGYTVFSKRTKADFVHPSQKTSSLATTHLWRSFFYVPGDKPNMITKMANLHKSMNTSTSSFRTGIPDLVVLDCEDAVAMDRKSDARLAISNALTNGSGGGEFRIYRERFRRLLTLRINSVDSGYAQNDVQVIFENVCEAASKHVKDAIEKQTILPGLRSWPGPDLVCLPKVESVDELFWLSDLLEQLLLKNGCAEQCYSLGIVAMIESCNALVNLPQICQSASKLSIPLVAIVFGSDDYCVSLGVDRSAANLELNFPRQYIPMVARAFGLIAIDMVDIDFKDMDKLRTNCMLGSQLGFHGKQTIHPAQLSVVNDAYTPSLNRIEWSKALLKAANEQPEGTTNAVAAGAFNFNGRMIDRPTLKQAERTVRMMELLDLNNMDLYGNEFK